jgi:hypothetical protein
VSLLLKSELSVSATLSALSLTRLSPPSCTYRDCSEFRLSVKTPAANPDGPEKGGTAIIMISALGWSVNATFQYHAMSIPAVQSYSPRSALTKTLAGAGTTVTFFLQNFPSHLCTSLSCRDEALASGLSVTFGEVPGTVLYDSVADVNNLLTFKVVAPPRGHASSLTGIISSADSEANPVYLEFDFAYNAPPALAVPSEGQVSGGTLVTLTAYGWSSQIVASILDESDVRVVICGTEGMVQSIVAAVYTTTESYVQILVRTPACKSSGTSPGIINVVDGSASSQFSFVYFKEPTIVSVTPSRGTLDGRTTASDGVSAILRLADLPPMQGGMTIVVTFAGVTCDGSVGACTVTKVLNGIRYMDVTVKIPPATKEGMQPVLVASQGRMAESVFEYYAPAPEIQSMLYCPTCRYASAY